jgi:hypothetical protein
MYCLWLWCLGRQLCCVFEEVYKVLQYILGNLTSLHTIDGGKPTVPENMRGTLNLVKFNVCAEI